MSAEGYLDGTKMATAFNMLRSGDLIWPYVVNNYMRGKDPLPFDLLYWNADSTRMAAANHSFYLRNCYLDNNLSQGMMELAGHTVSLGDITIPIYNLASKEDHIAPALIRVPRLEIFRRQGRVCDGRVGPYRRASSIRRHPTNTSSGPGVRRRATSASG
jgi:poly(3-hydroxyalkanoate) synthetase